MKALVDTSALIIIMNRNDDDHLLAQQVWNRLIYEEASLICTSYVLLETLALIQNRLGMTAVKDFQESIVPLLHIEWVDESLHEAGMAALLTANRRQLSLVDCLSFVTARRLGINTVFAFDQHFTEQGFTCLS